MGGGRLTQQKFTSHSSGSLEGEDQGAGRFEAWCPVRACFQVWRELASRGLYPVGRGSRFIPYKDTSPIVGAPGS